MVRTRGLSHIALAVKDAEQAFRFYQHVFDAVAVYREPGFIQAQTPVAWDALVFEEPKPANGSGGISRFGFRRCDPRDIDLEIWYELPTPADPS
jgi:catechol 2,3-dioxygenase-like lactoylglutathione lyase family enzyme